MSRMIIEWSGRVLRLALLLSISLCGLTSLASAGPKDDTEQAKLLDLEAGAYRTIPATAAQRESQAPAQAAIPSPAPRARASASARMAQSGAGKDLHALALESHDWSEDFAAAGPPRSQLQVSLSAESSTYQRGGSLRLFLGLVNHAPNPMSLQSILISETLARSDALRFRVESDTGAVDIGAHAYQTDNATPRLTPLFIAADGAAVDIVDFAQLVATRPSLFRLTQSAQSLMIRVEIPSLGLVSQSITLDVEMP